MSNKENATNTISDIIIDYLKSDSHFALMINGKWGSGKSYFIKEILPKALDKSFIGANKKQLIYTSANGISTFKEILDQILLGKLKIKNKGLIVGAQLMFEITKSAINSSKKYKPYVDVIEIFKKLFSDTEPTTFINNIIIIDDIERINFNKLPIEDFLGTINKWFTENDSIAVILIGDEYELLNYLEIINKRNKYSTIKEKTIIRTVEFKQDVASLIPDLFTQNSINSKNNVLTSEQNSFIQKIISFSNEENIRTINFFLNNLSQVKKVIDPNNFTFISKYIILFNFICSKAYKEGKLDNLFYNINHLSNFENILGFRDSYLNLSNENDENKTNEIKPYKEIAMNFSSYYKTFPSIYNYIKTGYLDTTLLNYEVEKYLPQLSHLNEWNIELEKLNNFRSLTIIEFRNVTRSIFLFLEQNKYDINSILKFANKYFFFFDYDVKLNNLEPIEFKEHICKYLTNAVNNEILTSIFSEEMCEKYIDKFEEAKEIISCYNEIYNIIFKNKLEISFSSLKEKLIDNLNEINQYDFSFLVSNIELQEIKGLLSRYISDPVYASSFNYKIYNEVNFIKSKDNKIDPIQNLSRFILKLKEIDIEKDSQIPYFIKDLDLIAKKKKVYELN